MSTGMVQLLALLAHIVAPGKASGHPPHRGPGARTPAPAPAPATDIAMPAPMCHSQRLAPCFQVLPLGVVVLGSSMCTLFKWAIAANVAAGVPGRALHALHAHAHARSYFPGLCRARGIRALKRSRGAPSHRLSRRLGAGGACIFLVSGGACLPTGSYGQRPYKHVLMPCIASCGAGGGARPAAPERRVAGVGRLHWVLAPCRPVRRYAADRAS